MIAKENAVKTEIRYTFLLFLIVFTSYLPGKVLSATKGTKTFSNFTF